MIGIIIAIIVFGVIITIHEYGHFLAAKLCNIKVNEFSIGMGPKIIGFGKKETKYSLRALPIGGYCAMEGESKDSNETRAFSNKKVSQRIIVVVAGATMNILLGFILTIVGTAFYDVLPSLQIESFHTSESGEISAQSYESGIEEGDIILSINGSHIFSTTDLAYKLQTSSDENFTVTVKRDGEKVKLENVKFYDSETESTADFYVKPLKKNVFTVLNYSANETIATAKLIWMSLGELLSGKYSLSDMSGPVGVVSEIDEAASSGETFLENLQSVLSLSAFITVNVGIFNLLPIPGLDGGRLLFLIIEAIRRKPIPTKYESYIHAAGMALMVGLVVIVTMNDVSKLF